MCIDSSGHTTEHDSQRTVFFLRKKRRAKRKSIGPKLFLKIKIENFYQKKQLPSKEAPPARLLSVAKNNALFAVFSSM